MSWNTAFEVVSAAAAACRGCGACVPRCEVLACAGGADEPLSVGRVAAAFADAAAGDDGEAARAAVAALAAKRPSCLGRASLLHGRFLHPGLPRRHRRPRVSPPCGCFCTRHALRATTASR
ncbi:MAG: hypothetical protein ACLSDQ_07230 [Adlercreutzia equolifaciens]